MTLTEILTQVHDLTLSVAEAEPMVQALIDAERDRNAFARAALEGQLATGIRMPTKQALAAECFSYADAMMAAAGQ